MNTSRTSAGLALLGLAAILDFTEPLALRGPDSAPLGVILLAVALGVVTLVALVPAARGSRPALLLAVAIRVVDALLGLPAFFLDAPLWVRTLVSAMLVLTVLGLVLVAPRLRRQTPTPA